MPLLPKGNKLDFDPDVITNAGKKLSIVQLENMKNPVLDPDFQVLSTLEAQKQLDDSMYDFEEMAGSYHTLVQRIVLNLTNTVVKEKKRTAKKLNFADRVGSKPDTNVPPAEQVGDIISTLEGKGRKPRKGKMYGGVKPEEEEPKLNTSLWVANRLMRPRYTAEHARSGLNTVATPSVDRTLGFAVDTPAYQNRDMRYKQESPFAIEGITGQTVPDLLFQLIQLTRRMDMLLNSRIKPAVMKLGQDDITKLQSIFQMVTDSYNEIRFPHERYEKRASNPERDPFTNASRYTTSFANLPDNALDSVEYGLMYETNYGYEIFSTWNEERRKLLLDLLIVINSWKQNSPAGAAAEFDEKVENEYEETAYRLGRQIQDIRKERTGAGRSKKMGGGRNFYGQVINDSKDIPTIYGHLQNCPTKYLL